ncbi:unnamed protein product [Paramecium pentaurelia]|uniref:Uncharacterized protein n=1 Tax=Paramecium pentaurelia TaxID=43138 RepID=A0A8S1UTL0_9CILI|nr:unnamed protein product [Paramecium pentaurelia]
MKQFLCLWLLIGISLCVTTSITECECAQLLTKTDCTKRTSLGCSWDETKNTCGKGTVTPPVTITYASYCQSFTQADCAKTNGCLWNTDKCTHFTGCTAFNKTLDEECQAISNKCITDGVHCVEIGECKSYLKQLPCKVNQSKQDCFWTGEACIDATLCEHYPKDLTTDEKCREKNKKCTVAKSGSGCQDSATSCAQQDGEQQCYFGDQQAKQKCFWTGNECVNRTCDKAPATSSYSTHAQCQNYDPTCTTTGAGCRNITTCSDAKLSEGCKVNSSNQQCIWVDNLCKDYKCESAPLTRNSNPLCEQFKPGGKCVTKKDGGCKDNGSCSSLDQVACEKDKDGGLCVFNVTCKNKTCENAPATNENHEACTLYLPTCTVNSTNKGCRTRTCDNAPNTINSLSDCNSYWPGCIPKKGGGCQTLTTCDKIEVAEVCLKDTNGKDCVWDTELSKCLDKTCANAPSDKRTSHEKCNQYLPSCTVNSVKNACIEMICENIVEQGDCVIDKDNKKCKYRSSCYKQECRLASQTITTHSACQEHMNSCTLDNTGKGCMPIPPSCGAIKTQEGCITNSNGGECAWASSKCQDKSCSTAPSTNTDNTACNSYKTNCLVNNTENGCIDPLTVACTSRQREDNCYSSVGLQCVYNPTKKCQARSCDTASDNTITQPASNGYLTSFSNSQCNTYVTGCVRSNNGNGCRTKAAACADYNQYNCDQKTTSGKSCFLNTLDNTCVDLVCEKIKLTTHENCENASGMDNACTVAKGASPTTCMTKLDSCGQYEVNQCKSTKSGKKCIWANNICREAVCSDASDSNSYNTHTKCNDYVNTCTVIERVDNKGCIPRKANCSDYTSQPQCVKNQADADCYWNGNNTCVTFSTMTCAQIVLTTYDDAKCETVKYSCKANSTTACQNKACTDYTKTDGKSNGTTAVSTDDHCKNLDSTCTIDNGTTKACMTRPPTCTGTTQNICSWSTAGQCAFDGTNCVLKSTQCSEKTGENLTNAICSTFNPACSANLAGTACVVQLATYCRKSTAGLCKIDTDCKAVDSPIVCANIIKGTPLLSYEICQDFSATCSVKKDGSACLTIGNCSSYTAADGADCVKGSDGTCLWYDADGTGTDFTPGCIAIASADCHKITVTDTSLNEDKCQFYHSSCYVNSDKSACYEKKANCSEYTDVKNCLKTSGGAKCYWYDADGAGTVSSPGCIQISTPSTDCPKLLKAQLGNTTTTDDLCKGYNASCVQNKDGTSCLEVKAACTGYSSETNCVNTSGGTKCYWHVVGGTGSCKQITPTDCGLVTGSSLLYADCQAYNTSCSVNSTGTACEAKLCTNKPTPWNHSACSSYLSTCTANKASSADACKTAPTKCSDVTVQADCVGSVNDGECEWIVGSVSGQCVKKTCYTKSISTAITHSDCTTYMSSCTVARIGGCLTKGACNTYLSEEQCKNGGNCFWNEKKALTCVDLSCDKIEDSYNTHELCSGITKLKCTVKSTGLGCQNRSSSCSSYNDKNCYFNSADQVCVMVSQDDGTSKCMEKACTTAGSSYTDHTGCYDYYKAIAGTKTAEHCTVTLVTAADGTTSPAGCQKVGACTDYGKDQCYVDSEGKTCVWDDTNKCRIKTCETAPDTDSYDSDDECKTYLDDGSCTVASDDMGCVVRPEKCEGMTEKQCIKDRAGNACQYLNGQCYTKSCSTAPTDINTKDQCAAYLPECTLDENNRCKLEICEDFTFTSDDECQKAKAGCTTNGTICVLRTSCQAVTNEKGCVSDDQQQKCQWISASSTCVSRTCATAPATTDYDTEDECKAYKEGCTTKRGGGCVVKSTCSAATAESACNFVAGFPNNKCTWENDKCRDQGCQDFSFSTHAECKKASDKINCTAGPNGKCTTLTTCEAAQVRAACIEGFYNGQLQPCLWIPKANNGNGACYQYTSCKSRDWKLHDECQWISNQCTTDGSTCLAITLCSETKTKEGCKVGYDKDCIFTVPAIDSSDPPICKAYTSCADAFYKTHSECQGASTKCTTNGVTSCAPLAACSTYTVKEACVINDVGLVTEQSTGYITSTGVCEWKDEACRDQACKDLQGVSHSECYSKLKGCTSDGANCLTIAACATYTTQIACSTAYGSDGPSGKCQWDATANNNNGACRVFQCSDITGGISTTVCQASLATCVSNGTICIEQANCSSAAYQNLITCNSGGKDGICVFTKSTATGATPNQGTCALMTSCTSAKNDAQACGRAKDRCSYTPEVKTGTTTNPSKCETHTCASYKQSNNGICANFLSWDKKTQQICVVEGTECKEKDPATLTQEQCYVSSGYTYTWNAATSKCGVCTAVQQNNNNTTTNPNTTTPNTDDSGYILGFTTIILGYLVF